METDCFTRTDTQVVNLCIGDVHMWRGAYKTMQNVIMCSWATRTAVFGVAGWHEHEAERVQWAWSKRDTPSPTAIKHLSAVNVHGMHGNDFMIHFTELTVQPTQLQKTEDFKICKKKKKSCIYSCFFFFFFTKRVFSKILILYMVHRCTLKCELLCYEYLGNIHCSRIRQYFKRPMTLEASVASPPFDAKWLPSGRQDGMK